jgi:hypothetical protein
MLLLRGSGGNPERVGAVSVRVGLEAHPHATSAHPHKARFAKEDATTSSFSINHTMKVGWQTRRCRSFRHDWSGRLHSVALEDAVGKKAAGYFICDILDSNCFVILLIVVLRV